MKLTDEQDKQGRSTDNRIRQLESNNSDLRFLNSQFSHQVEQEKKRADAAHNKAEEVFGRIGLVQESAGKNASSRAEKIFQRLQKIDIETGLEPLDKAPVYFTPPDPVIGDAVRLAQGRIESLEKQIHESQAREIDLNNDLILVREQLAKREREIARLGTQLEISRSQQFGPQKPSNPAKSPSIGVRSAAITDLESARDRIEQLEIQIINFALSCYFIVENKETCD